ncbi:MAG: N-acetylneuraminate synthase family protein [Bacillus sp. (in: firmicutes)]
MESSEDSRWKIPSQNVKIIAEIANAHQGKEENIMALIKGAAENGADGIKFQWFKYDHLAVPTYYAYEDYVKLFINEVSWERCVKAAKELGLEVWVDIFDLWGVQLLKKLMDVVDGIKLPPTVIQSTDLIKSIGKINKPVLLGVGGWLDEEMDEIIHYVKKHITNEIILMHGFQGYPTKTEDVNLKRIPYLKEKYSLPVGFADHKDAESELALELPVYAYLQGATIIEKHITQNRAEKGYDYYSSLEPEEFKRLRMKLQEAEIAMGSLQIKEAERKYLENAEIRAVCNNDLKKGEIITLDHVSFKRCPDVHALKPFQAEKLFPQIITANKTKNEPIEFADIKKPKITIAVICRLKSTRLPKKALLPIFGIPSIERCLQNCLAIPNIDHVVLATSNLPEDDPLEAFTMDGKVTVYRGSPDNVADRMLQVAELTNADIIIRITGDCPVVSPEVMQYLIEKHLEYGVDYTQEASSAMGVSGNIITVEALKRLTTQPKPLTQTEYLSFYFLNNPSLFSSNKVALPEELHDPNWRLTLDEPADLQMFEKLYQELNIKNEPLYYQQIKELLTNDPSIINMNQAISVKWLEDQSLIEEISKSTIIE